MCSRSVSSPTNSAPGSLDLGAQTLARHQKACYGQRFFVPVHHQAELLVHRGGNQRATTSLAQGHTGHRKQRGAPSLRELQPTASTTDRAPKGRSCFSCAVLEQAPGLMPTGKAGSLRPLNLPCRFKYSSGGIVQLEKATGDICKRFSFSSNHPEQAHLCPCSMPISPHAQCSSHPSVCS